MRVIIAGSRGCTNFDDLLKAIANSRFVISEVISGGAKGGDKLGELWAEKNSIPCSVFPAQWDFYGKKAGYLRNEEMANYAEALIAIWDGKSRGTSHMIDIALAKKLKIFIQYVNEPSDPLLG